MFLAVGSAFESFYVWVGFRASWHFQSWPGACTIKLFTAVIHGFSSLSLASLSSLV